MMEEKTGIPRYGGSRERILARRKVSCDADVPQPPPPA
eukprot:CAMPEP_0175916038 /NCGR_PEP_ID=MMETSP0108-20121206/10630_1 /TAXON_ID=195067 ORGANISM="Goniomonas pacifica, Strain CCMP1869" /NCGR_SAMPLE_ID=MMETSP0108 /ASSEMBLY_ACC=CAM_ASM_000204 /LENGTH=37 /DNA_ID= /DNA_START= /DNA_END= /DNA_ORIENTATION=